MTLFLLKRYKNSRLSDKFEMCRRLKQYHMITKVKAEIGQFMERLETMGVLNIMKLHSSLIYTYVFL